MGIFPGRIQKIKLCRTHGHVTLCGAVEALHKYFRGGKGFAASRMPQKRRIKAKGKWIHQASRVVIAYLAVQEKRR